MEMNRILEIEAMMESDAYADYIMANANGDRVICNGDTLTCAMEDGYLFAEYLAAIGFTEAA